MAKKNAEDLQKELQYLKGWCTVILDFVIERTEDNFFLIKMKEVVNRTYENQDSKGLRYCFNDIKELARGLRNSDKVQLNSLLQDKFGEDLNERVKEEDKKVKAILKNGRIADENEYRLVHEYVGNFFEHSAKKKIIKSLNELLSAFHK